ncbi:MAG: thioredoxin [actinobacterium acAMD-5]|nr:MAG: thioredoxin [actinobacterium acAMD-5]
MSNVKILTDASFNTEIASAQTAVVVDFWAEWCGPCKQVSPILEEIANENVGKIQIAKLNIDENPVAPGTADIRSIPTLNVYQGGQLVKQLIGAKPKAVLLAELAEFLK